jgi:hypothetical protein
MSVDTAHSSKGKVPSVNGQKLIEVEEIAPMPPIRDGVEPSKRRMPEKLRRFLLRMPGGKLYLPAAYRIVWFRDECPDWGIETILLEGGVADGYATVQAKVYNAEGRLIASGIKTETKQDFPAGWVEKSESGAISRALAVAGFGTQFMPELDDDGHRPADSPLAAMPEETHSRQGTAEIWPGPGQCPRCHAPEGKRHGKPCLSSASG